MNTDNHSDLTPPLWKLIFICSTSAFFALLLADAVPAVAHYYQTSRAYAEGVMSWYLLGYGVGPLTYAPLANRYGRKAALFIGFTLALLAFAFSIICIHQHWLEGLFLARLVAGIGGSAGLVVGMMLIVDSSTQAQARRLFSLIVLFFAFVPSIAMALGAAVVVHLGLISLFILMMILIVAVMLLVATLKETHQGPFESIHPIRLCQSYGRALVDRPFIYLALIYTMGFALMYVFNSLSPLVALPQLHISADTYSDFMLVPSLGLFCGALLSAYWSRHYSARHVIIIGMVGIAIAVVWMFVAFMMAKLSLLTIVGPSFFLFSGLAIAYPNASMRAAALSHNKAVSMSVMNALALIVCSIVLYYGGALIHHGVLMLPLLILVIWLVGLVSFIASYRQIGAS